MFRDGGLHEVFRQLPRHLRSSAARWIVPALVLVATLSASGGRAFNGDPTPSLYTERDPIVIDGNAAFTPENGVVSGSGTPGNPYAIGPWYIRAAGGPAVRIANTDAYFVVRDIQIESTGYAYEATVFSDAAHGRIERIDGQGRDTMVHLVRVRDFVVTESRLLNSRSGVRLEDSVGVVVSSNEIGSLEGIAATGSSVVTITDNRVSGGRAIRLVGTWDVVAERNVIGEGSVRLDDSGRIALRDSELRAVEINASLAVTLERNVFIYGGLLVEGTSLNHFGSHSITGNTVDGRPLRYETGCRDLVVDGESIAQLFVVDCERVQASNLTFDQVAVGIHLAFVRSATVTANRFYSNGWGIRVSSSNDSVLTGNTVFSTTNPIYLERTAHTLVHGNNIVNYGIPVDIDGTENAWYAPYPVGGNYWSYHSAQDYCSGPSQGICDGGDGVLDQGITPGNGIADLYPLSEPFGMVGEKPLVSFDRFPQPVPLGEITYFRADGSSDPNGEIWFYEWDFGDGVQSNERWAAWHIYSAQGLYVATLKIIDNQGLSAIVSHLVNVTEPVPRPVAHFTAPSRAVAGSTVHFDASASSTPRGVIEIYNWDFGDGTTAQGPMVDHVYVSEGTFVVTLEVRNDLGYSTLTQALIEIVPRIPLVPYSDPSGFSIPVPEMWGRVTNVEFEGLVIELGLLGPYDGDFQTNIIIDTDVDPTLRESDAFLLEFANSAIADIRSEDPSAAILEGPSNRALGGHGAVAFALEYPLENLVQKFAVVVSEPHARYWLLILTTTTPMYEVIDPTFEEMLGGFEITLATTRGLAGTLGPTVLGVAGAGALAAVLIVLAARSRRRRRLPGLMQGASRTQTALRFFTAAMGLAVVERIVRVAIVVAFWPAIAIFAPIDPERATGTDPQSAGLVAAGGILAVFLLIDALLVIIGLHYLRSGRSELGPEHSARIIHSRKAMVLYVVVAFVGNLAVSAALRSFLPWLGYTFSLNPARYAAFTLVNVLLAVLAGFAVFWIVERLLDRPTRAWAIGAFALGVGSAVAVMVIGLGFLALTPLPAQPTEIPFAFAMAEVSGDVLGGVSIILWLIVYLRTLDRLRRGELVAIPAPAAYSNAPAYVPPTPPTPP